MKYLLIVILMFVACKSKKAPELKLSPDALERYKDSTGDSTAVGIWLGTKSNGDTSMLVLHERMGKITLPVDGNRVVTWNSDDGALLYEKAPELRFKPRGKGYHVMHYNSYPPVDSPTLISNIYIDTNIYPRYTLSTRYYAIGYSENRVQDHEKSYIARYNHTDSSYVMEDSIGVAAMRNKKGEWFVFDAQRALEISFMTDSAYFSMYWEYKPKIDSITSNQK